MNKGSERKRRKTPPAEAKPDALSKGLEPTLRLDEREAAGADEPADQGRLENLIRQADRRVFPNMPPLRFDFHAEDPPPEEASELDFDEEHLDANKWQSDEFDTVTSVHHSEDESSRPLLTEIFRRHTPSGRSLTYTNAGFVAVIWQALQSGTSVRLALYAEGEVPWVLTLHRGVLQAMEGPNARSVAQRLHEEGLLDRRPEEEADAAALLQACLEAGRINRLEMERRLRLGREAALARWIRAPIVHVSLHELSESTQGYASPPPRLLAKSLPGALFEAARCEIPASSALGWLGESSRRLLLGAQASHDMHMAELQPEVIAYILGCNGLPLQQAIEAVPSQEGLAAIFYLLYLVESLVLR